MGRPDTDDGPEARLGVENDGPGLLVGSGLATGPDTRDSEGRPDIGDGPEAHLGVENDGPGSRVDLVSGGNWQIGPD